MILVERGPLLEGCRLAEKVLPPRPIDRARVHLLLQAQPGACTLQAAGSEAAVRLGLPAEVEEPGGKSLPARQALAILREADAEVLRLESTPGRLRLLGEGAVFDLAVPAPQSLAPVEPFPEGPCHQILSVLLTRALRRTLFAAWGTPTGRYALNGILWEVEGNQVRRSPRITGVWPWPRFPPRPTVST